jgi:hypothetical protein
MAFKELARKLKKKKWRTINYYNMRQTSSQTVLEHDGP